LSETIDRFETEFVVVTTVQLSILFIITSVALTCHMRESIFYMSALFEKYIRF